MNNAQQILMQSIPYNVEEIFNQICQYKIFEVNLKRAILMNDKSNIYKVRFINSAWFEKWKKISGYEGIKDELYMNQSIPENYKNCINNYYNVVQNLEITEKLDPNINNHIIFSGFNHSIGRFEINPTANFELISPELWHCFAPKNSNNINRGTTIELGIDYLTKNSLIVHLNKNSCYILFWKSNEQKIGKLIFIFEDENKKFLGLKALKNIGINNFNICFLDDLKTEKEVDLNQIHFKVINRNKDNYINLNNNDNINNNYEIENDTPVGLDNIGLTCYMNSALQSLVNIPKLSDYFLNTDIDEDNQILSHAYLQVVKNLLRKTKESKTINSYAPVEFGGIAGTYPLFQGLAGDSIDMVRYFLQTIHNELNFKTKDNYFSKYYINNCNNNFRAQKLNNFLNSFTKNNQSIITNTFFFLENSQLKCCNCGNISGSFGCLSDIIFPLEEIRKYKINKYGINENVVYLLEGFEYYQRQSNISGESQIACNFCGFQSNAIQCNILYSLPDILIINLNRGKGNIYNVGINYEERIDLSKQVETNIENNTYRLISIITHFGESGTSGHFISFCYVQSKKKWYEFNDSIVTESSFEEASTKGDSYVLFYQRE